VFRGREFTNDLEGRVKVKISTGQPGRIRSKGKDEKEGPAVFPD